MAPVRVGIIGLNGIKNAEPGVHNWSAVATVPSLIASPDYDITAVCNSTKESAQRAIEAHDLGSSVKAYGNPNDIADDPNVDLVLVSVLVTKHFFLTEPALLKKKKVFVEWPLGASTQEAETLAELAKKNNLDTIVGVQARADALVIKVKEIIDSGKIGKVTSTSVLGSTSYLPTDMWFEGAEYYLRMETGGNLFHIGFGHFLDSFRHVLGDFQDLQSLLKPERTEIPISKADGSTTTILKNVPDHILVQGTLKSGAVASIAYRWAELHNAADGVGIRWIITGTKGEIELTTEQDQWQMSCPRKLRLKLNGKETEEIDCSSHYVPWTKDIARIGVNVANILEAFAKGDKTRYADFESAVKTHRLLDEIVKKAGYSY